MSQSALKAPFPYFGGKSAVADRVWQRFGDVQNYIEPFAGSLAVLLARPTAPKTETVNDMDGWLTNFWRAVKHDPEAVAHHADWPVNEIDIAARRDWLFSQDGHVDRMYRDPNYYDAKLAGIWVWGVCSTIGNAFVSGAHGIHTSFKNTHLGAGRGIRRASTHLGDAGMGIHRASTHLGDAGRGAVLAEYFQALSARLERVRVMCGDWSRVTSPTVTTHNGLTGMFLDPPYFDKCDKVYAEQNDVRAEVREYCLANGDNPKMRIALCGYEGEHDMPDSWECVPWKARGGYGSRADKQARENCNRERIWFSPHCLSVKQGLLV